MPLLWGLAASPKRCSFIRDFGRRDCGTASSGTFSDPVLHGGVGGVERERVQA